MNNKKAAKIKENRQNYINIARSVFFYIYLAAWTLLCGILGAFTLITRRQIWVAHLAKIWAYGAIRSLEFCCGISCVVEGSHNIPSPGQGYILASKHQSAWETIFFLHYLANPAYVLKKELCLIPIFGWYLSPLNMVIINRNAGAFALKNMIKSAKNVILRQKRPLIIFPEGTRVAVGTQPECKTGIAALRTAIPNVPIIPVALNSGEFWPARGYVKKPGTIRVVIQPPLNSNMPKEIFLQELHKSINFIQQEKSPIN